MVKDPISRQTIYEEAQTSQQHTSGPKVLCAGLWRTGTSSLQVAFEEYLGLLPCLHGAYLVTSVERLKLFHQCCLEENTIKRRKLLAEWFDRFPASTDLPGFAFVDDLIEMYPEMRIILNKRKSPEAWLESVNKSLKFYASRTYFMIGYWDPYLYWHHQIYVGIAALFQRRHNLPRRELFSTRTYELHNAWVERLAIQHNRPLLEFEVSQGWVPLVQYLESEVPVDSQSGKQVQFPRHNEASDMQKLKMFLIWKGLRAWAVHVIPIVVAVTLAGGAWFSITQ